MGINELTPEQQEAELYLQKKEDQNELRKEREAIREKLKTEIFTLWSRNKDDKYHIGEKLFLLQQLHAKPGSGTFLKDVDELDIPRNTAYKRIDYYKHIEALWEAGYDPGHYPVRSRLYRNGKDNNSWQMEDLDETELAARQAAADLKQSEIDAIIQAEAEKVERARTEQRNRVPRLNISLLLPVTKREKFKEKWRGMDEKVRSEIVYKAVMDADTD